MTLIFRHPSALQKYCAQDLFVIAASRSCSRAESSLTSSSLLITLGELRSLTSWAGQPSASLYLPYLCKGQAHKKIGRNPTQHSRNILLRRNPTQYSLLSRYDDGGEQSLAMVKIWAYPAYPSCLVSKVTQMNCCSR